MKVVGARIPRYDGVAHVTGRTTYVDDFRIPGTLWAKALRSPHHHAGITKLDTGRAESMPGVHAVVTWEDVPLLAFGHLSALGIPADEPLLAKDDVRYKGQPIALVAAESEELASAAVDAIEIGFEERPSLLDVREAFDPDAPQIHQWGNWYPFFGSVESSVATGLDDHGLAERPAEDVKMERRQIRKGDIDWAFEKADTIVQGVYRPAAIEHAPLETQVCQVVPEPSGRLTIYSCTQALYFTLGVVAAHLKVPLNRLKLVGGTTGGGFGGKVDSATDTMTCLLALKANRPVKWRWTREEEFLCSSTRAPWHMEIASAVTKDGWILGQKMLTLHDSGAYSRFSPYGLTKHSFHHTGAYSIPNLHFDGYAVFTNRAPTTAMRGFGVTSVSFAVETHMSRIADVLGLDPIEIRLKNANRIGDTSPNGVAYTDPSTVPTLQAIAEAIGHELPADYRTMTNEPRAGELLPEHLVAQVGSTEGH
jgi:CO/xanthine dehydrogenase Mo-binding subunit